MYVFQKLTSHPRKNTTTWQSHNLFGYMSSAKSQILHSYKVLAIKVGGSNTVSYIRSYRKRPGLVYIRSYMTLILNYYIVSWCQNVSRNTCNFVAIRIYKYKDQISDLHYNMHTT